MASPTCALPALLLSLLGLALGLPLGANIAHLFANGALLRCPTVVTRADWGARAPARPLQPRGDAQATALVLRVTPLCATACSNATTCPAALQSLQASHMQRENWADIAYHFLIAPDGRVFSGRPWNRPGPASLGSARTLQVAFLGSYASRNINMQEVISLWSLKQCLQQRQRLSENYSLVLAAAESPTACGGERLFQQFRRWQSAGQMPS